MGWKLLSKGAEANIYLGDYLGLPAIKKERYEKNYRHPSVDYKLRTVRTRREARLLHMAKDRAKVPTPFVYYVNVEEATLIMEYIPGQLLRDVLLKMGDRNRKDFSLGYMYKLGKILAKLHSAGIIHGDFTTSNIIVHNRSGELFVIDFGLGYFRKSSDPEDYAIELRVFRKSLDLFHGVQSDLYFSSFLDGYREKFEMADEIIRRYKEIYLRGRYVVARRVKRTFLPS